MGWTEYLRFFCAATETARDVAEDFTRDPIGSLALHPLEKLMLPLVKWPESTLASTCSTYMRVMEMYVDFFVPRYKPEILNICGIYLGHCSIKLTAPPRGIGFR